MGRNKKAYFLGLKDRMQKKIDGWCTRFLSQGGKEVFIKSVLQAVSAYAMCCFLFRKTFCDDLEQIVANFWWIKEEVKKGIHWCKWKKLCKLKEFGGLGFSIFGNFNKALLAKQGWRLLKRSDSFVARVIKASYYPNSDFLSPNLRNGVSYMWKSIWSTKKILFYGLSWKIGNGISVSIFYQQWILGTGRLCINKIVSNCHLELVVDQIDLERRQRNKELITCAFDEMEAELIL